jgi:hypothetical protein
MYQNLLLIASFVAMVVSVTTAQQFAANETVNADLQAYDVQTILKEITPVAKSLLQTIGDAKKGCWINAEGRGVGYIPPLVCLEGEESDAYVFCQS